MVSRAPFSPFLQFIILVATLSSQPLFSAEIQPVQEQATKSSMRLINEVIFHLQRKAYTSYDLRQFETIVNELLTDLEPMQSNKIKKLSSFEAYVLYVICQKEAEALDLIIAPKLQSKLENENKDWKIGFLRASLYLQTKENLFADQDRFDSWFQMLKNKYDYLKKNNSISP